MSVTDLQTFLEVEQRVSDVLIIINKFSTIQYVSLQTDSMFDATLNKAHQAST